MLVHNKNAGLGAGGGVSMDQAQYVTQGRKNQRWQRAKARFDKIRQQEGGDGGLAVAAAANSQTQWVRGGTETLDDANKPTGDDPMEDCIEILSPGGSDDNPSNPSNIEADPTSSTSSSATVPSDTVTSVTSTTSTTSATAATVPNPAVDSRPKIQLKLVPKKAKEQLPTTSVVLDDGDDDEEEAMEVTASGDSTSNRTSRTNPRKATRWEAGNKDNGISNESEKTNSVGENKTDNVDSENQNAVEPTELENNVASPKSESGRNAKSNAKGKSARSPRSNKWVKIGADGGTDKSDRDEKKADDKNGSQQEGANEEGASSTSAITNMQNDSQTDSNKGRKRRTRRTAKKNEDMFADL